MNPDKLFDYLDGKLSPADREQLEKQLANDSQLLRQLAVARDIHRNMRGSREVIMPSDDPEVVQRAGRLGRRIATAAIVLVFINVLVGVVVITGKGRKQSKLNAQEAAIRQQLASFVLARSGQKALPVPSFVEEEIRIPAPRAEWERSRGSSDFGGRKMWWIGSERLARRGRLHCRGRRSGSAQPGISSTACPGDRECSGSTEQRLRLRLTSGQLCRFALPNPRDDRGHFRPARRKFRLHTAVRRIDRARIALESKLSAATFMVVQLPWFTRGLAKNQLARASQISPREEAGRLD